MDEGDWLLLPGWDCETPPALDLGRPFRSGVPAPVGSPGPSPVSEDFLGRAEIENKVENFDKA